MCVATLKQTTKEFSEDIWFAGRDSNRPLPEQAFKPDAMTKQFGHVSNFMQRNNHVRKRQIKALLHVPS
jgi:hypothetical protein